jgi:hypothetical protein
VIYINNWGHLIVTTFSILHYDTAIMVLNMVALRPWAYWNIVLANQ